MIQPTPGRIVWYNPSEQDLKGGNEKPMIRNGDAPLAAQIVAVHGDRCINLLVSDALGYQFRRLSVQLLQGDGQDHPSGPGAYAEWMPYQQGQAKKDEVPTIAQAAAQMLRTTALALGIDEGTSVVDYIARVCHEVNRGYCAALGDNSQLPWEEAPDWQKGSARTGVALHLANPDAGPEASHVSWMKQKEDEGWVYGPVKDAALKQHPCMVPFRCLTIEQQAKDFIFRAVVHALSPLDKV